jgi:predicted SAM-dependent methyltransferase
MQESLKSLPRDMHNIHVVVGIPTFGAVSIEFAKYLRHLATPMFSSMSICHPKGKPVDEARNEIVRYARAAKAKYIFFMDDDVIGMATDSLVRLLGRDADGSCPIVSGVYCVKQNPPMPLIFKQGFPDGFTDFKFGDFIEADAVGMGCCLIRTDVFDKIPEPWFKTQRTRDLAHPVGKLFDTCTEDIWFCLAAKQAGFKVLVDTAVQNFHFDMASKLTYCYNVQQGKYGWYDDKGAFYWYQTAKQREEDLAKKPVIEQNKPVKFNLGAGTQKFDGFMSVDMVMDADEKGDMDDIGWLTEKHGLADHIFSCHSLEHIPWIKTLTVLRSWCKGLKAGGLLEISVPDITWCLKDFVEAQDEDPEKFEMKLAKVFGMCDKPGEVHMAGFTENHLRYLASQLPLDEVEVETVFDKEKSNQPSIWLRGKKRGVVDATLKATEPMLDKVHRVALSSNGHKGKKKGKAVVRELVAAGRK